MRRFFFSLALACSMAGTLWASDDPFSGKWKLNMEKSKLVGEQIKIQDLGGNKYQWTSSKGSYPITYDGTDQQVSLGRTISMAPEGTNSWKMVIKRDGRVVSSMMHTLSADGKAQTITGTETKPDGTTSDFTDVWKKVSGGSGWGGTWESTDFKFNSSDEYDIEPYEGDGLSFNTPAYKDVLSMKFDGKDYEEKGPNVAPGSMSSGKRVNARTLEVTDKVKGQVVDHTTFEVSPDGKTLTLTIHETGHPKALTLEICAKIERKPFSRAGTAELLFKGDSVLASEPSLSALMDAAERGDRSAADALFSALYSELHRLAKRELAPEAHRSVDAAPGSRALGRSANAESRAELRGMT